MKTVAIILQTVVKDNNNDFVELPLKTISKILQTTAKDTKDSLRNRY